MKKPLDFRDVKPGGKYRLGGNTYAQRTTISSIGGEWNATEKEWILNLSMLSKTAYNKISNVIFTLARNGVNFYRG